MEDYGTPVQPLDEKLETPPQKSNSKNIILIIVAILVILMCCCVGVALLFYYVLGDMLLEALDIQVWLPTLISFS